MKRLLFIFAACSSPAKPGPAEPVAPTTGDPSCPMVEAGTAVTAEDTVDGGALVFVTSPASLAAVRERTATLAQMHNQHAGPGDAMGMMIGTKSTAVVEDVPTGARVVFTPTRPEDLGALQNELRMHAGHLQPGSCKMAM